MNKKIIALISIVVVCIVLVSSIYVYTIFEKNNLATIKDITISPDNPDDGDIITITAHLDGELFVKAPQFSFDVLFYNPGDNTIPVSGSCPMTKETDDTFITEIGPYDEGTQIWYTIYLTNSSGISFKEGTIDVGEVTYTSDIWLFDVNHIVNHFETYDSITITAKSDHEGIISEPIQYTFNYQIIFPNGEQSSASITDSRGQYNATSGYTDYEYTITHPDSLNNQLEEEEYEEFPPGTIIFYGLFLDSINYKYATQYYTIQIA